MKKITFFLIFSFVFILSFGQNQFSTWGDYSKYPYKLQGKQNNHDMVIKLPWLSDEDPGNDWWWTEIGEVKLRKEKKESTFPYYQLGLVEEVGVQFFYADYNDFVKSYPLHKSKCEKMGMKRYIIIAYSRSFSKDLSKYNEEIYYLGNCNDAKWNQSCIITNGFINPSKTDRKMILTEIRKIFAKIYDSRGTFPPKNKEDEKNEQNFRRVEKFLLSLR